MSCPKGKLINPATGNCVERTSSTGRAIVRDTCYAIGLDYNKKKVACDHVFWPFSTLSYSITPSWWVPIVPVDPRPVVHSPIILPVEGSWLATITPINDQYMDALRTMDDQRRKRFLYMFREIVIRFLCNVYAIAIGRGSDLLAADRKLLEVFPTFEAPIALLGMSLKDILSTKNPTSPLYSVFIWTIQLLEEWNGVSRESLLPAALSIKEEGTIADLSYRFDAFTTFSVRVPLFPRVKSTNVPSQVANYMCDRTVGHAMSTFILQHDGKFICVDPDELRSQLEGIVRNNLVIQTVRFDVDGKPVDIAMELFDLQRFFYYVTFRGIAISFRLYFYLLYCPILLTLESANILAYHPLQRQCHYQFEQALKGTTSLKDRIQLFVQSMNQIEQQLYKGVVRTTQEWSDMCSKNGI